MATPKVEVEAVLQGAESDSIFFIRGEMPFANEGGGVAGGFKLLCEGGLGVGQEFIPVW